MIAGDIDADQLMAVASLDLVGDDLFLAVPIFDLNFAGGGGVFDAGIKIAGTLEALSNVSFALFQQIGVD